MIKPHSPRDLKAQDVGTGACFTPSQLGSTGHAAIGGGPRYGRRHWRGLGPGTTNQKQDLIMQSFPTINTWRALSPELRRLCCLEDFGKTLLSPLSLYMCPGLS